MKTKYYSLDKILTLKPHFAVIIGTRSTGKTYACLKHGISDYWKRGWQMALVRRWAEDFKGKRGQQMFDALIGNDEIRKITGGEYNSVYYYSGRWFLSLMEDGERKKVDETPFAFGFAISQMEHDQSTAYPNVNNIVFDEMVTRDTYIGENEFVLFENVLSTIIRDRAENITVYMLANTVSKYCPYFSEMGLTNITKMKEGAIDLYHYKDSPLTVAVEMVAPSEAHSKPSDVFFAFDSPQLSMITGKGSLWEMAIYPRLPQKYKPNEIMMTYFIIFGNETFQCEVIRTEVSTFTYIHKKTTPIKDEQHDIVYTTDFSEKPNYRRKITKPQTPTENVIAWYYRNDKVFYQNNEVGEAIRSYLQWCGQ